ncbi:hypothetical protein E2C01_078429 [Portunus trituberculatus]|uniref:Uncharacterized protein n=1 Tax=Portunus trituberculatus TaxID=210409 RepID=A0A5B7IU47_PORTR|nr:hypothetical protein [Portunus trituberculatus]
MTSRERTTRQGKRETGREAGGVSPVSRGVKGRGAEVEKHGAASAREHEGERENKEYKAKEMEGKGEKIRNSVKRA